MNNSFPKVGSMCLCLCLGFGLFASQNIHAVVVPQLLDSPTNYLPDENGLEVVDASIVASGRGIWVLNRVFQSARRSKSITAELWRLDSQGENELIIDLSPFFGGDSLRNAGDVVIGDRPDGGVVAAIPSAAKIYVYGFSRDGKLDFESELEQLRIGGQVRSLAVLSPTKYAVVLSDSIVVGEVDSADTATSWSPEDDSTILGSLVGPDGHITLLMFDSTKPNLALTIAKLDTSLLSLTNRFDLNLWTGPFYAIRLISDVNGGSAVVMAGSEEAPQFQIARFDANLQLVNVLVAGGIPFNRLYQYDAVVLSSNLIAFATPTAAERPSMTKLWYGVVSGSGALLFEESADATFGFEVIGQSTLAFSLKTNSVILISNVLGTNDSVREAPTNFVRFYDIPIETLESVLDVPQ